MKPLRFRFSIATLAVVVAVVAIDIIWFRTIFGRHRSAFGFAAEGYDTGLFVMAHVLPFGLYPMIHRRGAQQRFLIGFEVGGLAAALGYAGFAWIAPETLSVATFVPFEPIWNLCFGWLSNGTLEFFITFVIVLALWSGIPQLLTAVVCGILIRRRCERRCTLVKVPSRGGAPESSPEAPGERSTRTEPPRGIEQPQLLIGDLDEGQVRSNDHWTLARMVSDLQSWRHIAIGH
jgi:hypothetical protein